MGWQRLIYDVNITCRAPDWDYDGGGGGGGG